MKQRRIILVVFILAALLAVLFYVERLWERDEKIELWAMVPESAAMVYESDELPLSWEALRQHPSWQSFGQIDGVQQVTSYFKALDSLADFSSFFTGKQLLVGLHVISKDELDFSYFFELRNNREQIALRRALARFEEMPHIRKESRQFNGQTIYELTDTRSGKQFSYLIYYNVFAASFTPFLVEDVVRNINAGFEQYSFRHHNTAVASVPRLTDDEGNFYINTSKLPLLMATFVKNEYRVRFEPLRHLCETIFLDVNLEEQLLLSGFSTLPVSRTVGEGAGQASSLLSTFAAAQPTGIGMFSFVPQRTAMLVHYAATGPDWLRQLHTYQAATADDDEQVKQLRARLRSFYDTELPEEINWLAGDAAVMLLESVDTEEPDKLMVLQVSDTAVARRSLLSLESRLRQEPETISYRESFAGYELGEISFREFPAALLGSVALGFEQSFYFLAGDYLVFANSVRALKRLIADRDAENTWDKSIQQVRFLDSTLGEANLSVFVNTAHSWRMFMAALSPTWRELAEKHSEAFKRFSHIALQFSRNGDDYYTSMALDYRPPEQNAADDAQFATISRLFVKEPLQTRPFVVRDHSSPGLKVLFQDTSNYLYFSSMGGELQWRDSIPGAIVGDVFQIDFYRNGKLQYLFATDSALHIVDRDGAYVDGYPLYMPEGVQISQFSLIDYDNSKRYRFLVTDQQGQMWMFNKARENLQGWNPNNAVEGTHACPPFHIRVRGRDYLIAISEEGDIFALNRRGRPYEGFPISLNAPVSSGIFTEAGSTAGNTSFSTITRRGELLSFNLLGSLLKREQIYRPSSETVFRLVPDVLGKTFVIARQDEKLFGLLDRNGKLLFEKNYISPAALSAGQLQVQYYDFGAGNELVALTDQVQEFTYLFDTDGLLIKDRPVESRFPVGILYYDEEDRFELLRNFENEFSVLSFQL